MTYRISKELFEAVRNHKINKINIYGSSKYFYIFDDYLLDHNKVGREESYNDFFFECIDWALKQKYILVTAPRTDSRKATCSFDESGKHDYKDDFHNNFREESIQQAVFDACQWILNQKGLL